MPRTNFAQPVDPSPKVTTTTTNSGRGPQYGDHSSSHWPPGWNFQRYSTASREDLVSLPDGELEKTQAGLREVLGEDGVANLAEWMFEQERERTQPQPQADLMVKDNKEGCSASATEMETAGGKDALEALTPIWLQQWSKRHKGANREWGFTVMRTSYDNKERWEEFKSRFQEIVEIPFRRDEGRPGVAEAREKFTIHWIEDPELEGVSKEIIREKYATLLPTLPASLTHFPIFLCASAASISSILSLYSPLSTDSPPSSTSQRFRPTAPYILANFTTPDLGPVEDDGEQGQMTDVFKVAVEVLVDELWWTLDADFIEARELTRRIRAVDMNEEVKEEDRLEQDDGLEDIWWSTAPSPERLRRRRRIG